MLSLPGHQVWASCPAEVTDYDRPDPGSVASRLQPAGGEGGEWWVVSRAAWRSSAVEWNIFNCCNHIHHWRADNVKHTTLTLPSIGQSTESQRNW